MKPALHNVGILAAISIVGVVMMIVSGGNASNIISISIYGIGSILYYGAVGAFCVSVGRVRKKVLSEDKICLITIVLLGQIASMWLVAIESENASLVELSKFVPFFFYVILLWSTSVALSARVSMQRAPAKNFLMLLFFPFFAFQLERQRKLAASVDELLSR